MLLTNFDTAQRLEEADVLHINRQVEAYAQLSSKDSCVALPIANGVAAFTVPVFGRKLNHIVGSGMACPITTGDLANFEDLYTNMGLDTEIDLCPHADATTSQTLSSRGYGVNGFINQYVRVLTDADLLGAVIPGVEIVRLPAERANEFPAVSVAGYKDGGRSEKLLETLGHVAVLRADTSLYFAMVNGKIAGSAGLALIETSKGGVAHLYIDSTLPAYRGRGIQVALLCARLQDARKAGYDLASVGARPQNGSSRNIERAGFGLAYTKTTFVKACKPR